MIRNRWNAISIITFAVTGLARSRPALACAACYGQSDSAMARGMNMGIFALLFVIVGVLIAISAFFVFVASRASKFPDSGLPSEFSNFSTKA